MDDESLIQELLYKGEGPTLDYKVKQYPFSGADDGQKSELLKDVLAFANAWRSEVAYILIGVKNDTLELVELDVDIDDSRLQEFINSKTNHPVNFSYRSLDYKGLKLGLYTIPVQDRPVYVRKQYGRVLANTVYVRRGSATTIADPSEVARMGAATVPQAIVHAPNLTVKIVGADSTTADELTISYTQWELCDKYEVYSLERELGIVHRAMLASANRSYYREMALYLQEARGKFPFVLEVSNSGDHFADDVKVFLTVPVLPLLTFKDKYKLLQRPQKFSAQAALLNIQPPLSMAAPRYSIKSTDTEILLSFNIGKLQAGESRRTTAIFIINPPSSLKILSGRILSDQLRSPVEISIPAKITVKPEILTMAELQKLS